MQSHGCQEGHTDGSEGKGIVPSLLQCFFWVGDGEALNHVPKQDSKEWSARTKHGRSEDPEDDVDSLLWSNYESKFTNSE